MADLTIQDVRAKYPQYGDMSDDQLGQALHQKFYADMPYDQFAQKIGLNPKPTQVSTDASRAAHAGAQPPQVNMPAGVDDSGGSFAKGLGDLAGAGLENIGRSAAQGLEHIGRTLIGSRTTGDAGIDAIRAPGAVNPNGTPLADKIPAAQPSQNAQDVSSAIADTPPIQSLQAVDQWLQQNAPSLHKALHGGLAMGQAIGNVAAPLTVGKAGLDAVGDTAPTLEARTAEVEPKTPIQPEFRNADAHPMAAKIAGASGREALTLQNNQLALVKAGQEAGIPNGGEITPESLSEGMQAPASVYNRVTNAMPAAPLSDGATAKLNGAVDGDAKLLKTNGPDVQAQLGSIRDQLLSGPMDGPTVMKRLQQMRQEGNAGVSVENDLDANALGRGKLKIADALEQHIEDSLPANAGVDIGQLRDARTAMAKNFAVQGAMKGKYLDMQALARMQRANPDLLTGGLKEIADFANASPEVSGLPTVNTRYTGGPSLAGDIMGAPASIKGVGQALFGRQARNILTGPGGEMLDAARQGATVDPGRFGPRVEPAPSGPVGPDRTGLSVGEGKASPKNKPGLKPKLGEALFSGLAGPTPPLDVPEWMQGVVSGRASPTPNPAASGASEYSSLGTELAGISVGEGKASPVNKKPVARQAEPTDYEPGLSVGEGKASPVNKKPIARQAEPTNDEPGLSVGEGKASPKNKLGLKPKDIPKKKLGDLFNSGE